MKNIVVTTNIKALRPNNYINTRRDVLSEKTLARHAKRVRKLKANILDCVIYRFEHNW